MIPTRNKIYKLKYHIKLLKHYGTTELLKNLIYGNIKELLK